jgi:hypothetical protein
MALDPRFHSFVLCSRVTIVRSNELYDNEYKMAKITGYGKDGKEICSTLSDTYRIVGDVFGDFEAKEGGLLLWAEGKDLAVEFGSTTIIMG